MKIKELSQSAARRRDQESSLFESYLNDFDKVKNFYQFNFVSDWESAIQKRANEKFERKKLNNILSAQNKRWNAPPQVMENISKLTSPNCFAVVTGQQAGIFAGPLYTTYKIITAIKLADWLKSEHPNYDFVPCFWMEVDDHDFREINHIRFFTKDNELRRLELSEEANNALKPVYLRQLNAEIEGWESVIRDQLYQTEFMDNIIERFFKAYATGNSHVDAFATLVLELFGEYGLIVLSPADPEIKKLGKPIYQKTIEAPETILEQLKERSERLAKSQLPVQIQFQSQQTLLFYADEKDQRIRIDLDEKGDFVLKYADKSEKLERIKLSTIIEESTEKISPNVALRPLVQDNILPTIAYVAGPAEIAYFAQLSALYDYFEQTMPIIYPRHRMTIVESKIQKSLERLEIDPHELFRDRNDFLDHFIKQKQGKDTFQNIESIRLEIADQLSQLDKIVKEVDPTLINAIRKTEQKIDSSIEQIMGKITNAMKQKEAVEINQIKKALLNLFPDDNYQERVINIVYFLIKYGPDFLNDLHRELPVDTRPHYLIYL